MPQIRKTRQQKIQQSKRHTNMTIPVQATAASSPDKNSPLPMSHNQEIAETQVYVIDELRRIGWISILCAAILGVATVFLADFSWAHTIRGWLPF